MGANTLRIEYLKFCLKTQYRRYQGFEHDCGIAMLKVVSSSFADCCNQLNVILNELATIDPDTPTRRF